MRARCSERMITDTLLGAACDGWLPRKLAPLRADVPERHLYLIAVDLAAPGSRLQGFDIPARAAEDIAQGLLGHRRPRPLLVGRIGVGEAAEQQVGTRSGGSVRGGGIAALGVVVEAVEHSAVDDGVER